MLHIIMCKYIYTMDSEPVVHALAVKHTVCIWNNKKETPKIINKDGYQDYQNDRQHNSCSETVHMQTLQLISVVAYELR